MQYTNLFIAAAVLATCAEAARPKLQVNSEVISFSGKSAKGGHSTTFELVPGKCMQAGSDAIRLDSKPPYYEDVSLKECARSCVDDFPGECVGVNYYVNDVPKYPRGHTHVRAHYKGDCFLASTTDVSECNQQNSGNVLFYAISEADLVAMDMDEAII